MLDGYYHWWFLIWFKSIKTKLTARDCPAGPAHAQYVHNLSRCVRVQQVDSRTFCNLFFFFSFPPLCSTWSQHDQWGPVWRCMPPPALLPLWLDLSEKGRGGVRLIPSLPPTDTGCVPSGHGSTKGGSCPGSHGKLLSPNNTVRCTNTSYGLNPQQPMVLRWEPWSTWKQWSISEWVTLMNWRWVFNTPSMTKINGQHSQHDYMYIQSR